jgi:hypothetical protein
MSKESSFINSAGLEANQSRSAWLVVCPLDGLKCRPWVLWRPLKVFPCCGKHHEGFRYTTHPRHDMSPQTGLSRALSTACALGALGTWRFIFP